MSISDIIEYEDEWAPLGPFVLGDPCRLINFYNNWTLDFESEEELHAFGKALVLAFVRQTTKREGRWTVSHAEECLPLPGKKALQFVAIHLDSGCDFVIPWPVALLMADDYLDTYLDEAVTEEEANNLWTIYETARATAEKWGIVRRFRKASC